MKTYVEMADDALRRIAEHEEGQRVRRARMVRMAVPAACVCLVVLLGVRALRNGLHEVIDPGPDPLGVNSGDSGENLALGEVLNPDGEDLPGSTSDPNGAEVSVKIIVNQASESGSVSADMDVQFEEFSEKLPYDVWEQVKEDFGGFCGIGYEDFVARLGQTAEVTQFYAMKIRGYKDGKLDEYRLHDYVFTCRTKGGGEVKLALCRDGLPLRDVLVVCDNPLLSEINGQSLEIIQFENWYQVNFSYRDANYDLEASDVTLEELTALLSDILR